MKFKTHYYRLTPGFCPCQLPRLIQQRKVSLAVWWKPYTWGTFQMEDVGADE
jgi:hypothetical protein